MPSVANHSVLTGELARVQTAKPSGCGGSGRRQRSRMVRGQAAERDREARPVLTVRIGIHHCLIFDIEGDGLDVVERSPERP
jgi:hypothetical protein